MDEGFPFLGLCLGHQLLAEVVGGTSGLRPSRRSVSCQSI